LVAKKFEEWGKLIAVNGNDSSGVLTLGTLVRMLEGR
jgi:hypothetical protein